MRIQNWANFFTYNKHRSYRESVVEVHLKHDVKYSLKTILIIKYKTFKITFQKVII